MIHGRWYWIDFATFPQDLPDALVQTSRRSAGGLKTDAHVFGPGDIDPILAEIKQVLALIRQLENERAVCTDLLHFPA